MDNFKEGDPIILEGEIRQGSWTDAETGETRYRDRYVAQSVGFVPRTGENNTNPFGEEVETEVTLASDF